MNALLLKITSGSNKQGQYCVMCPIFFQVTDLTKIRTVTRPPRDKKKHAVVLTFNNDSPKAFACDSGEFGET